MTSGLARSARPRPQRISVGLKARSFSLRAARLIEFTLALHRRCNLGGFASSLNFWSRHTAISQRTSKWPCNKDFGEGCRPCDDTLRANLLAQIGLHDTDAEQRSAQS